MFQQRVKFILGEVIVYILLVFSCRQAQALEGSISLQAGGVQAFQESGKKLDPDSGGNIFGYLDFKLAPEFSLGVGTGLSALMNGNKRLYIDGTLLNGRFSPWPQADWSPYLMAGAGFRPFYELDQNHRWLSGNFQASAGVGVRKSVAGPLCLDATAFYDYNSPTGPIHSLGIRAGLSLDFGGPSSAEWVKNGSVYAWKQGDSAQKIASKLYGDPDYADLLMDANKDLLANGRQVKIGERIIVPSLSDMKNRRAKIQGVQERTFAETSNYTVRKGESLWGISRKHYGMGHEWERIYEANKDSIKDPSLIYPLESLRVPGLKSNEPE